MGIFMSVQPYLIFLRSLVPSNREFLFNEIEINTSGYFEVLKTNIKSAIFFQTRGEDLFISL
jgi:hypothetical protein